VSESGRGIGPEDVNLSAGSIKDNPKVVAAETLEKTVEEKEGDSGSDVKRKENERNKNKGDEKRKKKSKSKGKLKVKSDVDVSQSPPVAPAPIETQSSHFVLVFVSTLGLTILSGAAMLILSISGLDTEAAKSAAATCSDIFKMGVAAILGLVGGKAVS
jgi:hypothetical protein